MILKPTSIYSRLKTMPASYLYLALGRSQRYWKFLTSLSVTALLLISLPFSPTHIGLNRVESQLLEDKGLKDITARCGTFSLGSQDKTTNLISSLIGRFLSPGQPDCHLWTTVAEENRFHLLQQMHYRLVIQTFQNNQPATTLHRSYTVYFPQPLVLLPVAGFFLSVLFEVGWWGALLSALMYLLFLSGGNPIFALDSGLHSLFLSWKTDSSLLGTLLIALWLALYRSHREETPLILTPTHPIEGPLHRMATTFLGLWSPAIYTLIGRLVFPIRSNLLRVRGLLNGQFFILCLSLYFFTLQFRSPAHGIFDRCFGLPRYFTFAGLLMIFISRGTAPIRKHNILWRLPGFLQIIASIFGIEVLSHSVPALRGLPTHTRIGIGLLISECLQFRSIRIKRAWHHFRPLFFAILAASFFSVLSNETGAVQLTLNLLDPRVHPSVIVAFSFFCGIGLGIISGGVTAGFFSLFSLMMGSHDLPLVRAALLDGILAGTLLSPFSLFNLFTAAEFNVKLKDVISSRFEQLGIPMVIATVIYLLSSINSIAILRPVTFIFLALVVVTFRLQKAHWKIGKLWQDEHNARYST